MKSRVSRMLSRMMALLLCASVAFAQQEMSPPPQAVFSQQELDQMLAPIALYPDSLLSQILMASTYPLEVVEAARWLKANPGLAGDQAVQAVAQSNWDPSVKSLVAFPQVISMMEEKLDWMERLGDAFLSQQAQVMDTVQNLRRRAYEAGNLRSSDQYRVEPQGPDILIEPPNPATVYVPYYDPMVVYGPWWWPAYPPVYWPMWPGYYESPDFGFGFAWGVGIAVGAGFFFGAFDWGHHHVNTHGNPFYFGRGGRGERPGGEGEWHHDGDHRRGVPYRDAGLRQQYGRTSQSPDARSAFRGRETPQQPGGFGSRVAPGTSPGPAPARGDGRDVNRPEGGRAQQPQVPQGETYGGRAQQPQGETYGSRAGAAPGALPAPRGPSAFSRPNVEPAPHAFEGVGHGADVRNYSARGQSSVQQMAPPPSAPAPRPAPSPRGGPGPRK